MTSDVVIRLSVRQLKELIERAPTRNYMLVQYTDADGMNAWAQVHPYEDEAKDD